MGIDSSVCSNIWNHWLIFQLKLNRIVVQKWVVVKLQKWVVVKLIISRRIFNQLCFVTCMWKCMLHASKLKHFEEKKKPCAYWRNQRGITRLRFLRLSSTSLSSFWGSFPVNWAPSDTSLAHSWHFLVSSTVNIFTGFFTASWLRRAGLPLTVLDKSWRAFCSWSLGFSNGFSGLALGASSLLPEVERHQVMSGRISGSSSSSFDSSENLGTS